MGRTELRGTVGLFPSHTPTLFVIDLHEWQQNSFQIPMLM